MFILSEYTYLIDILQFKTKNKHFHESFQTLQKIQSSKEKNRGIRAEKPAFQKNLLRI